MNIDRWAMVQRLALGIISVICSSLCAICDNNSEKPDSTWLPLAVHVNISYCHQIARVKRKGYDGFIFNVT
jgi:hypothetical protein